MINRKFRVHQIVESVRMSTVDEIVLNVGDEVWKAEEFGEGGEISRVGGN